jgi:hypothetical protein
MAQIKAYELASPAIAINTLITSVALQDQPQWLEKLASLRYLTEAV